jgi:RNA polymerase sigma-54 factor
MKQSLQLRIGQHLTMTPQLQQAIRLLQLSTLDLQQEIQSLIETNPMLETAEDDAVEDGNENSSKNEEADAQLTDNQQAEINPDAGQTSASLGDTATDNNSDDIDNNAIEDNSFESTDEWQENIPDDLPVDTKWDDIYSSAPSTTSDNNSSAFNEMPDLESRSSVAQTLSDHLLWQLNLTPMSDKDRYIATAIIDSIEPSGLLSTSVEELHESFDPELEIDLDEVEAVRHRIQQFDPIGVASTNLPDCLIVQLAQLPPNTAWREQAALVIHRHLPLLASRDFTQLMRRTRLKEQELAEVIALIRSLNPKPGDAFSDNTAEYVVPDVFVSKQKGKWVVALNPDIAPKIRINSHYASLIKRADNSSDNTFLRDNLQEAKWFLKSLHSRNETLLKVATRIVEHQQGFLEHGDEAMKPLILHDIAQDVEMHESTVSRVTTQKYMHTPRGIFELKYFFSSHVATAEGGECSSTAIRAMIKKLVASESARKPLSDNKISTLLDDMGIKVARRTVAKYRESMNVPPSNERKRLG